MPVVPFHLDADKAGSMVDRLDPVLHDSGDMMREFRNVQRKLGRWDQRYGSAPANAVHMPWKMSIGSTSFRDTQDTLHVIVVGDDGNLYASVDEGVTFQLVTVHANVYWDENYRATFAKHGDNLHICVGAVTGDRQNLRYNGISAQAFGVSLAAPTVAPTVADGGVGGAIEDGTFDYFVAFVDAETGRESGRSPVATVVLDRPAVPDKPPTLAVGVAGLVPAGIHRYTYTFYRPADGIESEQSALRSIDLAANSQVEMTDVRACPDAGVWQRRIYRDDDGAGYFLLATIADNATTTYSDNIAAPAGAEYAYPTRQIELTAIATSGETGRTVHRRIYRQDDGSGSYGRLATIADDTTVAYTDTLAAAPGALWVERTRIPPCHAVAFGRDEIAIYGNDAENNEPARIYVAAVDDPESLNTDATIAIQSAGTGDDPIVGLYPVRDGVAVFKRKAIHWVPRTCRRCECVIEGTGAVAWATIRNVGSQIAFLSDMGPCVVSHEFEEDWRFVGPTPRRFCLAEFWETVLEDRLPWATCTHYRKWGLLEWHVQRCEHDDDYVSAYGNHNDTSIVWDYGCRSVNKPGGDVWIMDRMIDCGFELPTRGLTSDAAWGAYPLGYVGPLYDGKHGDGTGEAIVVQVLSVDGQYITIGDTNLLTGEPLDIAGEGWRGSIFYVVRGTGNRVCQKVVEPCWRPAALIVDHSLSSGLASRRIKTATALSVDATSIASIGGWVKREWIDGVDADNPDGTKTMPHFQVFVKGTI